jgi:uncharacterized protein (DUF302 family)
MCFIEMGFAMSETAISTNIRLKTDFETAVSRVTEALKTEGFGVLTEIDVKTTLKNKLDVEFRPYKILGACNPSLAYRALQAAPEVGLLLPCNVTVSQIDPETVEIAFIDPIAMLTMVKHPELENIAHELRMKLERVAQAV